MEHPKVQLLISLGINKLKEGLGKAKTMVDNGTAAIKDKLAQIEIPGLKTSKLKSSLTNVRNELGRFKTKIEAPEVGTSRLQSSLGNIKGLIIRTIGIAAITAGIGSAISSGMEGAAQKMSFQTMGGDLKGSKLYNDLTKFAQDSIFGNEVYKDAQTMLAFGVSIDKVMPRLKMLGDISMGDKERLGSLTLAYSQIMATGRLMGQDLLQLVNAGFNPLQIISQKTGLSMSDLKDKMENGAISADMVTKAFEIATSAGGRFYQMTDKIGSTAFGQWEAFKGQIQGVALQFGTALLPAVSKLIPLLSQLLNELPGMLDGFIPLITDGLSLIGPFASELFQMAKMIANSLMPILMELAHFLKTTLGPALKFVSEVLKFALDLIDPILKGIEYVLSGLSDMAKAIFGIKESSQMKSSYHDAGNIHGAAYSDALNNTIKQKIKSPADALKASAATDKLKDAGAVQGDAFIEAFGSKLKTFKYDLSNNVIFDTSKIKKFSLSTPDKDLIAEANANREREKQFNHRYGAWFNDNFDKANPSALPREQISLPNLKDKSPVQKVQQKISLLTKDMWDKMHTNKSENLNPDKAGADDKDKDAFKGLGKGSGKDNTSGRVVGSSQQVRNISIRFDSYIKGDVISKNEQIGKMSGDELDRWLRDHFVRLTHSVEDAY